MTASSRQSRLTLLFVNWAHALDHFVLLIFPTAVIAVAAEFNRDYSSLISLSTGAFVAFGLFALPVGWLADRFGRHALMGVFFFGYGASCLMVAASASVPMLAISLLMLGIFSAIYHPIGSSIIVANTEKIGRALGINGVWGNMGAALASGITAALAAAFGWRVSFLVPGVALIATGIAFVLTLRDEKPAIEARTVRHSIRASRGQMIALLAAFMTAIVAGGLTFNIVTISMPKLIDERLGLALPLAATGWLTTAIFICGAATQVTVGRLIDRIDATVLFAGLAILQPIGLVIAAFATGIPMALGLVLVMASIYGQVVLNDAMVGRYVPDEYRNRVYSVRFFVGFTAGGLAVPLIGSLHRQAGFQSVLLVSGAIGTLIFLSAVATWALTRGRLQAMPAPAE